MRSLTLRLPSALPGTTKITSKDRFLARAMTGVTGVGQAGTSRFEVGPGARVREVAGEAVLATPQAVVFRLLGRPGERVAFVVESASTSDRTPLSRVIE